MPQNSLFQKLKRLKTQEKVHQALILATTLQSDSGCSPASLNLSLSTSFVKTAGGFSAGVWASR